MLIVFALGGLGWWWWQRRQPKPVEDEWVLPPPEETPNLTRRTTEGADLTQDAQAGGLPGAPGGWSARGVRPVAHHGGGQLERGGTRICRQ